MSSNPTNCLKGCIKSFAENSGFISGLLGRSNTFSSEASQVIDSPVAAPWVKVSFVAGESNEKEGQMITVGNESAPGLENSAVITNFSMGLKGGSQCTIEILDEMGSAFHTFIDRMAITLRGVSGKMKMRVQFGWITQDCNGAAPGVQATPQFLFMPTQIEPSYEMTKVRYTIHGTDMMQAIFASREQTNLGNDSEYGRLPLKDALEKLFIENEPKTRVRFGRKTSENQDIFDEGSGDNRNQRAWKFKDDPKGSWLADAENKLSAALKMIEGWRTDGSTNGGTERGILPWWDSSTEKGGPQLIFYESPYNPDTKEPNVKDMLATFIVGGGSCSKVIAFRPKINYVSAWMADSVGGNTGSGASGRSVTQEDKQDEKTSTEEQVDKDRSSAKGATQTIPPTSVNAEGQGFDNTTLETAKSQRVNALAYAPISPNSRSMVAINAELVIQGTPIREFTTFMGFGRRVGIAVVGPFRITGDGCGDYLAKPACNILSSKDWMTMGFSHEIKDGKYYTTLDLFLAKPATVSLLDQIKNAFI